MPLITRQELFATAEARGVTTTSGAQQRLFEIAKAATGKTFDLFLSHSFSDARLIYGVYSYLANAGLTVYVDWIEDAQLDRTKVTPATAALLRERMRASRSLIYAASENTPHSKWMPWELGYFDGYRRNVAILPISETVGQETYSGQEYLGLYPYVAKDAVALLPNRRPALRVHTPGTTARVLLDWARAAG